MNLRGNVAYLDIFLFLIYYDLFFNYFFYARKRIQLVYKDKYS